MSELEERVAAIEKHLGISKQPQVIDWSRLDVNTPIMVWDYPENERLQFFERHHKNKGEFPFIAGRAWVHASLETGIWVFNAEGRNPWPEGVRVRVRLRGGATGIASATDFRWEGQNDENSVVASCAIRLDDGWVYE